MYEAYFGLRERPFSIAPDPHYLYLSPRHRDALAHLLYGIHERGGFVQLTGEVGTGKTTLTRALLNQLPADVDLALILNPNVTVREFLVAICDELAIALPKRSHSPQALMDALTDYLLDAYARGRHTVVLVDEAQNLSSLVLEQVRLLTNLETTKEKLLQIILVGQPELRELLRRPDLRQVAQRITARYHLVPLSAAETGHYIRHRLAIGGVSRPLFTRAAAAVIHRRAGGIPRLINVICDRALLGGYGNRLSTVGPLVALRAAREVAGEASRSRRRGLPAAAAAVLIAAAAGLGLWWQSVLPVPSPVTAAIAEPAPARAVASAPSAPTAPASLAEQLASGSLRGDADRAFGGLLRLWDAAYLTGGRPPCEQAGAQGLRCHYESGDWKTLRRRALPAVIELRDSGGGAHQALLVAANDHQVRLRIDGEERRLSSKDLMRLWTGESVSVWRPPAAVTSVISPGSKGPAVEWLRRRLDRIEPPVGPSRGDVYDADLQRRVRDFQQARGLAVDGVVGENTLMHLLIAAPDSASPSLATY